jgi:regulator of protease activity HflC (stomatin/prohibitin superfamily)
MLKEYKKKTRKGLPMLSLILGMLFLSGGTFIMGARFNFVPLMVPSALAGGITLLFLFGLFTVQPNESKVLTLFGKYAGTAEKSGLQWANPFFIKSTVSKRVRNFETDKLKVNDQSGSPIEIAAVVVWKVVDTAEAMFEVDNFTNFVHVQSEAALRNLATRYAYDSHEVGENSLRANTEEIATMLQGEIQSRLEEAGVQVLEARISHLAYAPEIASAMLRRQQASAVIAARKLIVQGAVGMVEEALESLGKKAIVDLDNDKKAAMVSNLLVVLCGEQEARPVLNTGH